MFRNVAGKAKARNGLALCFCRAEFTTGAGGLGAKGSTVRESKVTKSPTLWGRAKCFVVMATTEKLEREKSLELSTYTLARYRSTN